MRIVVVLIFILLVACTPTTSCTYDSECTSWAVRERIETEECPGVWECIEEQCRYSCTTRT